MVRNYGPVCHLFDTKRRAIYSLRTIYDASQLVACLLGTDDGMADMSKPIKKEKVVKPDQPEQE